MMAAGLPEKKKRGRKPKEDGGSFLSGLKKGFGSVAKVAAPIAKDVLVPVATDVGKQMLTNYMTGAPSGSGLEKKKRGRPKKSEQGGNFMSSLKRGLGSVAKVAAPIAQQVAVPLATQALTSYLTSGAAGSGLKKRAPSKRNLLIKEIMAKTGKSLPEASKYVKEHKLA
jgi:hypothetical protein